MRRVMVAMMLAALLVLMVAPVASARVHGITPLSCEGIGNANSGGNATQGDSITGLIPRDVGNADLNPGDGGFRSVNNPHCS